MQLSDIFKVFSHKKKAKNSLTNSIGSAIMFSNIFWSGLIPRAILRIKIVKRIFAEPISLLLGMLFYPHNDIVWAIPK